MTISAMLHTNMKSYITEDADEVGDQEEITGQTTRKGDYAKWKKTYITEILCPFV